MDEDDELERELRAEGADGGTGDASEGAPSGDDAPTDDSPGRDALEHDADDEVACERCGDFHDPAALLAFDGQELCEPCVHASCHKPWSPKGIGALSFLLGFGGAGVVHAINQRRLGYEGRVWPRALLWLGAFAVGLTLLSFVPEGLGRGLGIGMNVAALLYFARAGDTRYEAYKAAGGETGSWLAPIAIAVGTLALAAAVVFGAVFLYATMRFTQAEERLDAGDYDAADEIFDEECEAGDPAACTNVGWIAEQREDYARARAYYRRACAAEEPMGCNNLGLLMESGRGGPVETYEARRRYLMACELGEQLGCDNAQALGAQ